MESRAEASEEASKGKRRSELMKFRHCAGVVQTTARKEKQRERRESREGGREGGEVVRRRQAEREAERQAGAWRLNEWRGWQECLTGGAGDVRDRGQAASLAQISAAATTEHLNGKEVAEERRQQQGFRRH